MRWSTGGSWAVLVCAVVVGCADEPGRPTAQEPTTIQGADASAPWQDPGATSDEPPGEPPGVTSRETPGETPPAADLPGASAPGVTATVPAPAGRTGFSGAPGSPITYDITNLNGLPVARVREVFEGRIREKLPAHCRPTLCGIRIVTGPKVGEGDCFERVSPEGVVSPGGTVTLFPGAPCSPTQPEESVPDSEAHEPEPEPVPDDGEPDPGTAGSTSTAPTGSTTGGG